MNESDCDVHRRGFSCGAIPSQSVSLDPVETEQDLRAFWACFFQAWSSTGKQAFPGLMMEYPADLDPTRRTTAQEALDLENHSTWRLH
jgi:hypothetical protein